MTNPRLLLHICCAPCSAYVVKTLVERFEVIGFFYGPNIHPREEHELRKSEAQRLAQTYGFPLLTGEYDVERWHAGVEGLEGEKEGGDRCNVCYRERLSRAAETARDEGCDFLASTLTVSPHKKASIINPIGEEEAARFGVRFYAADFKKKDGFKKSCRISKELGLYRQNYCGCIYSMRQDILL